MNLATNLPSVLTIALALTLTVITAAILKLESFMR